MSNSQVDPHSLDMRFVFLLVKNQNRNLLELRYFLGGKDPIFVFHDVANGRQSAIAFDYDKLAVHLPHNERFIADETISLERFEESQRIVWIPFEKFLYPVLLLFNFGE